MSIFSKYKSIPSEASAVRFTHENKDRVHNELMGQYAAGFENGEPVLKVTTLHGEIAIVRIGDWVVKDKNIGTYYPVKHGVFCEKYVQN